MRIQRALALAAVMAIAVAGLPVRIGAATRCHGCCPAMAACCQIAPLAPSTPVRSADAQEFSAQSAGHFDTPAGLVPAPTATALRVFDRHGYHLRIAVLRV